MIIVILWGDREVEWWNEVSQFVTRHEWGRYLYVGWFGWPHPSFSACVWSYAGMTGQDPSPGALRRMVCATSCWPLGGSMIR